MPSDPRRRRQPRRPPPRGHRRVGAAAVAVCRSRRPDARGGTERSAGADSCSDGGCGAATAPVPARAARAPPGIITTHLPFPVLRRLASHLFSPPLPSPFSMLSPAFPPRPVFRPTTPIPAEQ
eukprot:scaffold2406_cov67-Isochrysis_galbana.AAC.1